MPRKDAAVQVVTTKLELQLVHALEDWAERNGVVVGPERRPNISVAVRLLLMSALEDGGSGEGLAKSMKDEGYEAGKRAGLHAIYEHLKDFRP